MSTSFDLNIDEIIEEAYERCAMKTNSGYDLRSARRSLNLLFSEWGNRGIHLWKVEQDEKALVSGQAEYTVDSDVSDVLEAFVSTTSAASNTTNTDDLSLTKIDRSAYAGLPNKFSTGTPSQYYVAREKTPKIFLYQTPDLNNYTHLKYFVIKRIEDAGTTASESFSFSRSADVVYRFLPCMCAGLAYYLSMKKAPQLVQQNKIIYEDEMKRALDEDGQRTSVYISPQSFNLG